MESYLAMGLFAFYVMIISLLRITADREHPHLTAMKKRWGRSRGLQVHFAANVALPLLLGIVFLTRGVVGIADNDLVRTYDPVPQKHIFHHIAGTSQPDATVPAIDGDRPRPEKKRYSIENGPYPRMTLS